MLNIKTLIKFLVVAALLYFMGSKGFLSLTALQKAFTEWNYMIPAYALLFCGSFMSMYRWQFLLRVQKLDLNFAMIVKLSFIGQFFNIALPGAVSGDIVKAHYVAKSAAGMRAKSFSSIFFDRVIGLSALVLVSMIALLISQIAGWGLSIPQSLKIFVYGLGTSVLLGFGYLFLVREHHDPLLMILRKLEKKITLIGSITRIYEGLREYQNHRKTVFLMILLSMVTHGMCLSSYVLFCYALGEHQLPPLGLFVLMPLAMVVTAIPLAPGGMGTGHAAFLFLLKIMGSDRGADLFNLILTFQVFFGLLGAIVYLRFKSHDPSLNMHNLEAMSK